MNLTKLREELRRDEGLRLKPYRCSEGHWTVGYGHFLGRLPESDPVFRGITLQKAEAWFELDLQQAIRDAERFVLEPGRLTLGDLSDARQRVLVNMSFQLGLSRLRGFRKFRSALIARDWDKAADEMLDSRWAKQTPNRARRLADMMRNG